MKYIKLFEKFINEEIVYGLKKINSNDSNIFFNLFNSDPLKLREFIQYELNLQNLKFIAGGSIGLAFSWKDKVLKFTTDLGEKRGVEKMIELSGDSKLPGFAKYFWIKEVSLPGKNFKKFVFNATAEEELKIKKQRELKSKTRETTLTTDEILKRKSSDKIRKAYIICMEKIKVLDERDKEIAHFIFLITKHKYLIPENNSINKLKSLIDWIKSEEEEYREEDFLNREFDKVSIFSTFNKGITKKSMFSDDVETRKKYEKMWSEISTNYFINFSIKILNIYEYGNKLGIPTSDIHENNLGYRDNELVAFDCM